VDENDCGGGGCLELSREQGLLSKCECLDGRRRTEEDGGMCNPIK
jgi:hypothetical protein